MSPHPDYWKPPFTWTGEGCPIWRGRPTQDRVRKILYWTGKDREDRLYYREPGGTMRRLDGPGYVEAYWELNRILGPGPG